MREAAFVVLWVVGQALLALVLRYLGTLLYLAAIVIVTYAAYRLSGLSQSR